MPSSLWSIRTKLFRFPKECPFTDAAAIPEAFLTAWDALVTRGRLGTGDRVLVHAVASGVGTAATQIAKHLGAVTIGTSRNAAKLDRAREYGLDRAIDTSAGPFRTAITEPVHVILDVLGGPAFADNLAVLAPRGRLVMLGFLQGGEAHSNLDPILRKRPRGIGTCMRIRPLAERCHSCASSLSGSSSVLRIPEPTNHEPPILRPVVGATYPMSAMAEAHRAMERDETFGKVVVDDIIRRET
jgi:NADPH:quinone reductase-like Zn-dependent oxidoreductase